MIKTVAQQAFRLKSLYPSSNLKYKEPGKFFVWKYCLDPTGLGEVYTIEVRYKKGKSPEVYVIDPVLEKRNNEHKLPHIYSSDKSFPKLCLYDPKKSEWNSTMFIADSIIPWAAEWIFFYQIWLLTGKWHAAEVTHGDNEKKDNN